MVDNYRDDIRKIHREIGKGDPYAAMQNLFYGINQRATGTSIAGNSDHYGLTFFTRPRLNLSYHNVLAERRKGRCWCRCSSPGSGNIPGKHPDTGH